MVKERFQRGQTLPFHPGTPFLTRLEYRRRFVEASSQRRSCMMIGRAQSVSFWGARPLRRQYPAGGASAVSTGRAQ